ncbi:MAG: cobyric acid synthase [Pseudomonadota bacterium]
MTARAIMLQGTGSDVGKSVLVAGLCRVAKQAGLTVAPFKPQNMSNNAHACSDGGEIGRAQAVQAQAAGVEPTVDLNPVLLKPETDRAAQVIVHGKVLARQEASSFINSRDKLLPYVLQSFNRLSQQYDLIIVEGAGSPAEVNLRARDIANMGFARTAGVPVSLIADIDRGGIIASLVGTQRVLDPVDAAHIRSFIVNKFRGDPTLFEDGVRTIEQETGWACHGVVPWLEAPRQLPAEDAVVLDRFNASETGTIKIVAPMLPRMANFDDIDPLRLDPSVSFDFVRPGQALPRDADVVLLLGTKSTIADLTFLRSQGWDHDLYAHARTGGYVMGICGGYQMLGKEILDPDQIDGTSSQAIGLGLLDVTTKMTAQKRVQPVAALSEASRLNLSAYEIHMGITTGPDTKRPLFLRDELADGAQTPSGRVQGTYLHGIFGNDEYRAWWLSQVRGAPVENFQYQNNVEAALDDLAAALCQYCDVNALLESAEPVGWHPAPDR